jgi:hypothetical protein
MHMRPLELLRLQQSFSLPAASGPLGPREIRMRLLLVCSNEHQFPVWEASHGSFPRPGRCTARGVEQFPHAKSCCSGR